MPGEMTVLPMKGIGGHQRAYRGGSDDWLTPPGIIEALGPFDLDPCASVDQPWQTALTEWSENGLAPDWFGYVWCNPPYGPQTWTWLSKLATHGNGIALTFARTETVGFHAQVWGKANSLFFFKGRLFFHHPVTGLRAEHNAGGPSVLAAYGEYAISQLEIYAAKNDGVLIVLDGS